MKLGFIGFGEAASAIASGLRQAAAIDMAAYDAAPAESWKPRAKELGVSCKASVADVAVECDVIFSLVTAQAALQVAEQAAPHLREGALYADFNSCSPAVKRAVGDVIARHRPSAQFAAVAVMSAVKPHGHRVPMVVDGNGAHTFLATFAPYGCRIEVLDGEVGGAALLKMCRSAVLKGLEALFLEALLAAETMGLADRVLDSLDASFPDHHLRDLALYLVGRNLEHAERRAHELGEVVETLRSISVKPLVAEGGYRRLTRAAHVRAAMRERPDGVGAWLRALARAEAAPEKANGVAASGRSRDA
ncbi:NAD(P)-dependent oxidoreductase [Alicyclobacillus mali (ex Roth et al. 2021)]|uniref:NAD(P)-dependent oxidoreductase n=1 Tax=Alicyclobacillus mali (ex Roth et al. 2021) TaxID=1123961 RepID=UPI001A8CE711|nr:NAD(P)-dependent oxidoreductase [Alicyclobacillus mali (ex Roth et al. 2021)]